MGTEELGYCDVDTTIRGRKGQYVRERRSVCVCVCTCVCVWYKAPLVNNERTPVQIPGQEGNFCTKKTSSPSAHPSVKRVPGLVLGSKAYWLCLIIR